MLLLMASLAACSDRVPAPVTPTPSPRPGYPPAPVSELPEGVLYLNNPTLQGPPPLFRLENGREAAEVGPLFVTSVSPDASRAAALTLGPGRPGRATGIGILAGSAFQEIETSPHTGWPSVVWSADGKRLAFMLSVESNPGRAQVWTVDAESGEKTPFSEEADSSWMLGWTAAGEVLMRAPDGLALLGKTRRAIALPEPGTVLDAQVSPDGRSIAIKLGEYEQDPQTELTYVHSTGIWVLGLTGGGWREIVDLSGRPPAVLSHGGEGLLWSPEATRLVYQTEGGGESTDWETRLVDVRTGEEELLAAEYSWGRSWSRDGRYLAYMQSASGYSAGSLQILGPDGRTRRMANVRQMAWTKDGRLMVDIPGHLSLLDPETMELDEVQTDSGEPISALVETPVWSPSGRYLALATPTDMYHRSSIYIIDTEKGTAELFLDKAGFAPVAWLRE
jgi:hypothetical protein